VSKPALKVEETSSDATPQSTLPPPKQKLPALLVTSDDSLWAELGGIDNDWVPKQLDSVDELVGSFPAGSPGVVLWDARAQAAPAAALSRLQLHSDRLAVIALDSPDNAASWARALEKRQIAAHVSLPIVADTLSDALKRAREEIDARVALLGVARTSSAPSLGGGSKKTGLVIGVVAVVVLAGAGALFWQQHQASSDSGKISETAVKPVQAEPEKMAASKDDKVDTLIERAQQAILDRHYLDPADNSALSLYREALILDPRNGEATQGLQRLAGILIARVQSALDDRKFDVALQALETARSISPDDSRLAALDERISSVRNEFGTTQIQAALNAQNFDRAGQLIDEAARAKSVPAAKLAQLRDDMHHRRDQTDLSRLVTLIDARLQQDRLLDPHNDSADYYLNQARQAGAATSTLQPRLEDFVRRMVAATHSAIDQHRYADADRYLVELHNDGTPAATISSLQRDLAASRTQPVKQKSDTPPFLDLARSRMAQGSLVEPDSDSALYYVNQLRAADPQNAGLAQVTGALQAQIVDRARTALSAGDTAKTESLLRLAGTLGASSEVDGLNERLLQAKLAVSGTAVATSGIPDVAEASLTRTKQLKPQYPHQALARNVEGWVEIGYTVTSAGKITDAQVLKSNPAGVFDSAGLDAVNHLRYQPPMRDGKATAVFTKIRVAFRLSNE
jgi:TonB family protein